MSNKNFKIALIVLNGIMLLLAIKWYTKKAEEEPLICIIGQGIILLSIFIEIKFSKVKNIKNEDSEIETEIFSNSGVEVINKKNKGSKIKTTMK